MATSTRNSKLKPLDSGLWTQSSLASLGTGIYTLWLKHMRKFFSSSMEIVGTLFTPAMWMLLFGVCMESMVQSAGDPSYQLFITPGVMLLTGLAAAVLGGATLMIERLNGVIKEYLVAPVPRLSILLGTLASGLTKAMLQCLVVIWLGFFLDASLRFNPAALLAGLGLVAMYSLGFVGIAAAVACKARNIESYHSLILLLNLPVFFLSNALYPLDKMPGIFHTVALLNPTTYAVDATRYLMYGLPTEIGLWIDLPVLVAFMVFGVWFGYRNFQQVLAETY